MQHNVNDFEPLELFLLLGNPELIKHSLVTVRLEGHELGMHLCGSSVDAEESGGYMTEIGGGG